tara:strand:+ start:576 stop:1199 length:624 start_codon:yes stop_codon:yes gene_type:complete
MSDEQKEEVAPDAEMDASVDKVTEVVEGESAVETPAGEGLGREEELEKQLSEMKDQLLRAVADSENYRKRAEREKEQTRKFGIATFAKELLSVADNLGRALEAVPKDRTIEDEAIKNLVVGVEMTEQELQKVFDNNSIRRIDPLGEKFDYNFHQAMFEVEDTEEEPGIVVQVLQAGYAIEERVLRPAMVGVSKAGNSDKAHSVDTTA